MQVLVACPCGNEYELKEQFSGKLVKCPKCGAVQRASASAAPAGPLPQADPLFDRDLFLLRQKAVAINEKYSVSDEQGQPLMFVERPAHLLQNLFAVGVGAAGMYAVYQAWLYAMEVIKHPVIGAVVALSGIILMPLSFAVFASLFARKRHVTFYRDFERQSRIMQITQDQKLVLLVARYTLRTPSGAVLARFRKNYFTNVFRKKWIVEGPGGKLVLTAKEDSIILSLLRRMLGPLFGFLRTNFLFVNPNGNVVGEFKRKFTILDRYVLDMSPDRNRRLDRRVALALGVMLDTGERR